MNEYGTKEAAFADLRVHYGTARSYLISGSGRNRVTGYRNGVMTNLGDLTLSEWTQKIQTLIAEHQEETLQENLLLWLREHNYTRDSLQELREEALKLHAARIFDNPLWVSYIPWNRRFRPEALDESRLVWVETVCCRKPGQVTREQIDKAYQHTVSCPHCGRFSEFAECQNTDKENAHERE